MSESTIEQQAAFTRRGDLHWLSNDGYGKYHLAFGSGVGSVYGRKELSRCGRSLHFSSSPLEPADICLPCGRALARVRAATGED